MSNFKVTEIIDSTTIRVFPSWQLKLKDDETFMGDKIVIRGLILEDNEALVKERLNQLLVDTNKEISFNAPELVDYIDNPNDAKVSCSVYLAKTNILYYFPEFIHTH
jgi:hypothetical protein